MLLFANNATTEVAGSISATATQINVAAGEGVLFPNPAVGDYFVATLYKNDASQLHEIIWVTARSGDTMTIVRAQENTQAIGWDPGDTFSALITAGMLGTFDQGGMSIGPENLVYVGVDSGGPNVVVVPVVTPVIGALVRGMTFNILIMATNTGPTTITINGFATFPMTRLDGSPLVGGNLTGGVMMKMWFDGTRFVAPILPVPVHPASQVFYLDIGGNDSNDGLTPGSAFQSVEGAVQAIESRYASQSGIQLRFAPGTYVNGANIEGSYIASWDWLGDLNNPGSVIIDARPPSAISMNGGRCLIARDSTVTVRGITLLSEQQSIAAEAGSTVQVNYCVCTPPTSGIAPLNAARGGTLWVEESLIYNGTGASCQGLISASDGSRIIVGVEDANGYVPLEVSFQGSPNFTAGTFMAVSNGVIAISSKPHITFVNANLVVGRKFWTATCGGISGAGGDIDWIPGNQPGVADATSFGWYS